MSKPTVASLSAEIEALKARIEALEAKPTRRGAWQPSSTMQALKAECIRRMAAGERVKVMSGKVIAY